MLLLHLATRSRPDGPISQGELGVLGDGLIRKQWSQETATFIRGYQRSLFGGPIRKARERT